MRKRQATSDVDRSAVQAAPLLRDRARSAVFWIYPAREGHSAPTRLEYKGRISTDGMIDVQMKSNYVHCAHCLEPGRSETSTRSGCRVARYCRSTCARADWPSHRSWCQAAQALDPLAGSHTPVSVVRAKVWPKGTKA